MVQAAREAFGEMSHTVTFSKESMRPEKWGEFHTSTQQHMPTEAPSKPMKTKAAKKGAPDKSAAAKAKADLAKGAAEIQKLRAKKGVDVNTKKKPAKRVKVDSVEPPPAKIVPSKDPVEQILERCVKASKDGTALTLNQETTAGEYLVIFDHLTGLHRTHEETFQLLLGDLIIAGETLPAFGGERQKYAAAMIASGRSLDTLKAYRSTAFHTPKKLRLLPYSHLHATVKVPAIEDKTKLIEDAAAEAKEGHMPSVKVIRERAAKFKAKKTGAKAGGRKKAPKAKKETRDLTGDETQALNDMEDAASRLAFMIEGGAFLLEAKSDVTSTLREKLDRIARFSAQLAE